MTLGKQILNLRNEHHLSQADLAEKIGVSRQSISKWETGASIPDLNKLIVLSDIFSVSLDVLVKNQEPVEKEGAQEKGFTPQEMPVKYPPRKIVGYILLGVGLLSVVLGLTVNILLSFLGGYLLLCSIICLTFKNYPGLVIGWGIFSLVYGFIPIAFNYTEETMKSYLILSWCVISFFLLLVFFTAKRLYRYLKTLK